jgi:uncharacterized repeat protein (TIGR01451 family)
MSSHRISLVLITLLALASSASAQTLTVASQISAATYAPIGHTAGALLKIDAEPFAHITFSYTVPAGTTFVGSFDESYTCTTPGIGGTGNVRCTAVMSGPTYIDLNVNVLPSTAPGAAITYSVTVNSSDALPASTTVAATQTAMVMPELSITTTFPTAPIVAGSSYAFDATVHNNGPGTAEDVHVGMSAYSFQKITSATPAPCVIGGNMYSANCSVPTLAPGASATVHFVVSTSPEIMIAGAATGDVGAGEFGNSYAVAIDIGALTVRSSDVQVTGSAPATVNVGDDFTYTFTASSGGPSASQYETLSYTTPPGTTFKAIQTTGGHASPTCTTPPVGSPGPVQCWVTDLRPSTIWGQAYSGTVSITLHAVASGTATHLVTATTIDDPNASNNTSSAVTQIVGVPVADLSVTITADHFADASGAVAGSASVHNSGPDAAANVMVRLTAPHGTAFALPSGCQAGTDPAMACTIASLASGATAVLPFHLSFQTSGPVTITATATSTTLDMNTQDNSASANTYVSEEADLRISMNGMPGKVAPNEPFTFSLTVTSSGTVTVGSFGISASFPDGVTIDPLPNCVISHSSITCYPPPIAPGGSATVGMSAHAPQSPGSYTATFFTTSSKSDPDLSNNTIQFAFEVASPQSATAHLNLQFDPQSVEAIPAQVMSYAIKLRNDGGMATSALHIVDSLPGGMTALSAIPSIGSCTAGQTIVCQSAPLAPGGTITINVTAIAPLSGTATNTVTATSDTQTLEAAQTIAILPTSRHRAARH